MDLKGWESYDNDTKIRKEFVFENFKKALEFVNSVGQIAEELNHHPNIYLHDYKKVKLELWTHEIGGVGQKDFILASRVDKL